MNFKWFLGLTQLYVIEGNEINSLRNMKKIPIQKENRMLKRTISTICEVQAVSYMTKCILIFFPAAEHK